MLNKYNKNNLSNDRINKLLYEKKLRMGVKFMSLAQV